MIDYDILARMLQPVFGITVKFTLENAVHGFAIIRNARIVNYTEIYSAGFFCEPKRCEFILWFDVMKSSREDLRICVDRLNDVHFNSRFATIVYTLEEHPGPQRGERNLWLKVHFIRNSEPQLFNEKTCFGAFHYFFEEVNLRAMLWKKWVISDNERAFLQAV